MSSSDRDVARGYSGSLPTTERRSVLRSLVASGVALSLSTSLRALAADRATCPVLPEETSGPFPADGMGGAPGPPGAPRPRGAAGPLGPPDGSHGHNEVPNILAAPGIVRFDIRSSFGSSSAVAAGVPLRLELTLLDAHRACRPLSKAAVYLWNCDREGQYSLYGRGIEHENYLRGVQFTDESGRASFMTIFPACYAGRYPHLHLEIFRPDVRSLDSGARILTTQLTAPADNCARVYAHAPGYQQSLANFAGATPRNDMIFRSSSAAQLVSQTLTMSGDLIQGLSGRATLGIAA